MQWVDRLQAGIGQSAQNKIQEHWPAVQQLFREKLGNELRSQLSDPEKVITASKIIYAFLPMPVHLVVKEDVFVQFCLAHKDELVWSAVNP